MTGGKIQGLSLEVTHLVLLKDLPGREEVTADETVLIMINSTSTFLCLYSHLFTSDKHEWKIQWSPRWLTQPLVTEDWRKVRELQTWTMEAWMIIYRWNQSESIARSFHIHHIIKDLWRQNMTCLKSSKQETHTSSDRSEIENGSRRSRVNHTLLNKSTSNVYTLHWTSGHRKRAARK